MRFLSSCFYQGNSHNLSRDTKRGFLYPQIVVFGFYVVTRNEEPPNSPRRESNLGQGGYLKEGEIYVKS